MSADLSLSMQRYSAAMIPPADNNRIMHNESTSAVQSTGALP